MLHYTTIIFLFEWNDHQKSVINVENKDKQKRQIIIKFFYQGFKDEIQEEQIGFPRYFMVQRFLYKHLECNAECQDFIKIRYLESVSKHEKENINLISIEECYQFLRQIIDEKSKLNEKRKSLQSKRIFKIKNKKLHQVSLHQRQQIEELVKSKYKIQLIAHWMNLTVNQIRSSRKTLNQPNKVEIFLSEQQKEWIIKQCSQNSNSALFSAEGLYNKFKKQFLDHPFSLCQFRKLLKCLDIKFRVPSLKPMAYFKKANRIYEVQNYIINVCSYLKMQYKLIFIDESALGTISKQNHRQWHLKGSFKLSMERLGFNHCLIAAIGSDNFVCFQIIAETGKGEIFKSFFENLVLAAKRHYKDNKFVCIFDNCSIHKCSVMKEVLGSLHYILTPPYRPDFNGVELLFSWLKRQLIKNTPQIQMQFLQTLHASFSKIKPNIIENWVQSIQKPLWNECKTLIQNQG